MSLKTLESICGQASVTLKTFKRIWVITERRGQDISSYITPLMTGALAEKPTDTHERKAVLAEIRGFLEGEARRLPRRGKKRPAGEDESGSGAAASSNSEDAPEDEAAALGRKRTRVAQPSEQRIDQAVNLFERHTVQTNNPGLLERLWEMLKGYYAGSHQHNITQRSQSEQITLLEKILSVKTEATEAFYVGFFDVFAGTAAIQAVLAKQLRAVIAEAETSTDALALLATALLKRSDDSLITISDRNVMLFQYALLSNDEALIVERLEAIKPTLNASLATLEETELQRFILIVLRSNLNAARDYIVDFLDHIEQTETLQACLSVYVSACLDQLDAGEDAYTDVKRLQMDTLARVIAKRVSPSSPQQASTHRFFGNPAETQTVSTGDSHAPTSRS